MQTKENEPNKETGTKKEMRREEKAIAKKSRSEEWGKNS